MSSWGRALSKIRVGKASAVEEKRVPGCPQIFGYHTYGINNPSEEAIFGSNKLKEKHETMKFQNEEV